MTEHLTAEDAMEDVRAMRNLRYFVGAFVILAALLAVGVGIFAP